MSLNRSGSRIESVSVSRSHVSSISRRRNEEKVVEPSMLRLFGRKLKAIVTWREKDPGPNSAKKPYTKHSSTSDLNNWARSSHTAPSHHKRNSSGTKLAYKKPKQWERYSAFYKANSKLIRSYFNEKKEKKFFSLIQQIYQNPALIIDINKANEKNQYSHLRDFMSVGVFNQFVNNVKEWSKKEDNFYIKILHNAEQAFKSWVDIYRSSPEIKQQLRGILDDKHQAPQLLCEKLVIFLYDNFYRNDALFAYLQRKYFLEQIAQEMKGKYSTEQLEEQIKKKTLQSNIVEDETVHGFINEYAQSFVPKDINESRAKVSLQSLYLMIYEVRRLHENKQIDKGLRDTIGRLAKQEFYRGILPEAIANRLDLAVVISSKDHIATIVHLIYIKNNFTKGNLDTFQKMLEKINIKFNFNILSEIRDDRQTSKKKNSVTKSVSSHTSSAVQPVSSPRSVGVADSKGNQPEEKEGVKQKQDNFIVVLPPHEEKGADAGGPRHHRRDDSDRSDYSFSELSRAESCSRGGSIGGDDSPAADNGIPASRSAQSSVHAAIKVQPPSPASYRDVVASSEIASKTEKNPMPSHSRTNSRGGMPYSRHASITMPGNHPAMLLSVPIQRRGSHVRALSNNANTGTSSAAIATALTVISAASTSEQFPAVPAPVKEIKNDLPTASPSAKDTLPVVAVSTSNKSTVFSPKHHRTYSADSGVKAKGFEWRPVQQKK